MLRIRQAPVARKRRRVVTLVLGGFIRPLGEWLDESGHYELGFLESITRPFFPFLPIMPRKAPSEGAFPMQERIAYQGITFDDVLLEPAYSDVVPREVDVRTQLTRNIRINIPIVSSPMDTVTESDLAIALAQEGGIGIIHKNLSIPDQTREVDKVKRSENGIIVDPITLPPDETVGTARRIMEQHKISAVPITVNGYLKGILTRRDLRFLTANNQRLAEAMPHNNLVTAT